VSDGRYGDGITLQTRGDVVASLDLSRSHITASGRAGISSFGARVAIVDTAFECNAIDLNGERRYFEFDVPFSFEDRGGNRCGCGSSQAVCGVVSSGLEAPAPPEAPTLPSTP
jgi:hypothetical protein